MNRTDTDGWAEKNQPHLPHLDTPLGPVKAAVRDIHWFMRERSDLSHGTVVSYRAALWQVLVNGSDPGAVAEWNAAKQWAEEYATYLQDAEEAAKTNQNSGNAEGRG